MHRFMHEEKGSVSVLMALAMVVLIGFSALAIDLTFNYLNIPKRNIYNGNTIAEKKLKKVAKTALISIFYLVLLVRF